MSQEGSKTTEDGHEIFYRVWRPASTPAAVVLVSHGYAEHSGRYGNLGAALTAAGYAVYVNDHRGHGKSAGLTGHVDSYRHLLQDLLDMVSLIREKEGENIPLFLLGHSFGSIIAVHFAAEYQDELNGLILSGTGVRYGGTKSTQRLLIRIFSRITPKKMVRVPLEATALSHDKSVIDAYLSDPLVFAGRASFGLLRAMVTTMSAVKSKASMIQIPILIQKGSKDPLVLGEKELYDAMTATPDKTLKVYEGLLHEVYNESPEMRAQVMTDLIDWLKRRS